MKRLLSTALVCLAACATTLTLPAFAQSAKPRSAVQGTTPYAERSEALQFAADIVDVDEALESLPGLF